MTDSYKQYLYQQFFKPFCFLITLLLPAAVLLGVITHSISPAYPHQAYKFLPADEQGLTQTERLDLALITLAYLKHPEPAETAVSFLAGQRLPGTNQPLYNDRELAHLVDVKQLTDRIAGWSQDLTWLLGLSLLALLAWPPSRYQALRALQRGAALSYFLFFAFVAVITFFWPLLFYAFHYWLFPPGSWSFDGADTLIRLFPERFWVNYAEKLAVDLFVIFAPLLLVTTVLTMVIDEKSAPSERPLADPFPTIPGASSNPEALETAADPENNNGPYPLIPWRCAEPPDGMDKR